MGARGVEVSVGIVGKVGVPSEDFIVDGLDVTDDGCESSVAGEQTARPGHGSARMVSTGNGSNSRGSSGLETWVRILWTSFDWGVQFCPRS